MADDFAVVDEGHFEVELVEIAVEAVGAGVFVTEARGNLEVFGYATDHEKLLELLGSLGKSVELTWMETGGDEEIASTFGTGVSQNRSGDFGKIVVVHVVSDEAVEFRATL